MKFGAGESRKALVAAALQERWTMKLFTGWTISAGLVFAAMSANAQEAAPQNVGRPGSVAVSDFSGPYAAMPPDAPVPGYGPTLLPSREVYSVLRENGFLPLGVPRLRGFFYSVAVTDRRGGDGRLVIDARDGQIVRFVPAYRMGDNFNSNAPAYGPPGRWSSLGDLGGPPRPPASVPNLASRTLAVPLPKAAPSRPTEDKPLAEKPAPQSSQQSAAVQVKPADTPQAPPGVPPPAAEVKPAAPLIQPTQPMPQVQGLD
jgi:hypothetical protein